MKPGGKISISDIVLEKELPDFIKKSLAGHVACVSGAEKLDDYIAYVEKAGFKAKITLEEGIEELSNIFSNCDIKFNNNY